LGHDPDPFEAELDLTRMQALDAFEPGSQQGRRLVLLRAQARASEG
jgi:hypothetical protein